MNTITGALASLFAFVSAARDSERGATATEYALLVGLIALALVIGVGVFGQALNTWFEDLGATVGQWV